MLDLGDMIDVDVLVGGYMVVVVVVEVVAEVVEVAVVVRVVIFGLGSFFFSYCLS